MLWLKNRSNYCYYLVKLSDKCRVIKGLFFLLNFFALIKFRYLKLDICGKKTPYLCYLHFSYVKTLNFIEKKVNGEKNPQFSLNFQFALIRIIASIKANSFEY